MVVNVKRDQLPQQLNEEREGRVEVLPVLVVRKKEEAPPQLKREEG
jgi:hypothetical protein